MKYGSPKQQTGFKLFSFFCQLFLDDKIWGQILNHNLSCRSVWLWTILKTKLKRFRIPGVNFTNVLRAALTRADPKSAIKLLNLTVVFALLGSTSVKAARRMLVKLNPRVNFINMLMRSFYVRKCCGAQLLFHQQNYAQLANTLN